MADTAENIVINFEVLMRPNSFQGVKETEKLVDTVILQQLTSFDCYHPITDFQNVKAKEHIERIQICDIQYNQNEIHILNCKKKYFIYHFASEGPEVFDFGWNGEQSDAGTHWLLPSKEFSGLWENLIFDGELKGQLLKYVTSTLRFSELDVNPNILPWNKIVLLHGPPGTGKTSLCKALAQKISIRFQHKFQQIHLLEINSHSLFSKWFSESGKLVAKLFAAIGSILETKGSLLIVLVDEVESLAHSRKASFAGSTEPSDSIRVVNALLTHLDQIRRKPNVLILTTSNITEAIDLALVDRADIRQYVGLPSANAIYQIYYTCIAELQRVQIITTPTCLLPLTKLFFETPSMSESKTYSDELLQIAKMSMGLSGRSLRKLPLLAHAMDSDVENGTFDMKTFLVALEKAVTNHKKNNDEMVLSPK